MGMRVVSVEAVVVPSTTCGKYEVGAGLRLTVSYLGRSFSGALHLGAGGTLEQMEAMFQELVRHLQWFALEFYFYGCGGPNHVFDGDATDLNTALACLKCGAVKKENMSYPGCLNAVA